MSEIRVRGISLYYEEHGTGDPILCIHGGGSSALLWGDAVGPLAARGRVIVYDRRGCTRSERPNPYEATTVAEHADDAAALLRALGATPAIVIGRSYGAEIAVDLVQRYPDTVRALVLLEPASYSGSPESLAWGRTVAARFRAILAEDGPAAAIDHFYRSHLGDTTWQSLPAEVRDIFVENAPALLAELNGDWFTPDADALARVAQPVLIVSGASSPPSFRATDDALARLIPEARHNLVAGGHLINPATPVVLAFVDEVLNA